MPCTWHAITLVYLPWELCCLYGLLARVNTAPACKSTDPDINWCVALSFTPGTIIRCCTQAAYLFHRPWWRNACWLILRLVNFETMQRMHTVTQPEAKFMNNSSKLTRAPVSNARRLINIKRDTHEEKNVSLSDSYAWVNRCRTVTHTSDSDAYCIVRCLTTICDAHTGSRGWSCQGCPSTDPCTQAHSQAVW